MNEFYHVKVILIEYSIYYSNIKSNVRKLACFISRNK